KIIIADSNKLVSQLGLAFKLPIEVIPFASNYVVNQLKELGGTCIIRQKEGQLFITEQGNWILDADFGPIQHPFLLSQSLNKIVGLVCHGLFVDLASIIIMGEGERTKIFSRD